LGNKKTNEREKKNKENKGEKGVVEAKECERNKFKKLVTEKKKISKKNTL